MAHPASLSTLFSRSRQVRVLTGTDDEKKDRLEHLRSFGVTRVWFGYETQPAGGCPPSLTVWLYRAGSEPNDARLLNALFSGYHGVGKVISESGHVGIVSNGPATSGDKEWFESAWGSVKGVRAGG
jgi:hypothetical protein